MVVLRTSRYLSLALRQAAERWPHSEFAVVAPARIDSECGQARRFEFSASHFSLWTWWRSTASTQVRAWRPDELVLQLPEPGTLGTVSLGLVALSIAPHGFWFVVPNGDLQFMSRRRWLADLAVRSAWMAGVVTAIPLVAAGSVLAWPAYRLSRARALRSDS